MRLLNADDLRWVSGGLPQSGTNGETYEEGGTLYTWSDGEWIETIVVTGHHDDDDYEYDLSDLFPAIDWDAIDAWIQDFLGDLADTMNPEDFSNLAQTVAENNDFDATELDGTPHLEYRQSTGELYKVEADGTKTLLGTGYSGDKDHYNNPASESLKEEGVIPKGYYDLDGVTSSKGPNTIVLTPDSDNEMYNRDAFRIHGDNNSMNHTASEGCIILGPTIRAEIIEAMGEGYDKMVVVP